MKHLKSYAIFESFWTLEEFCQELARLLGQWNLTTIYIRELISKLDIESLISQGKTPLGVFNQLVIDLDLKSRGKEGYMQVPVIRQWGDKTKYL
jgi:hypothetical protein